MKKDSTSRHSHSDDILKAFINKATFKKGTIKQPPKIFLRKYTKMFPYPNSQLYGYENDL